MKLSDFNFNLPKHLISQFPSKKREDSRLLVISRYEDKLIDTKFYQIINFLQKGDTLVLNNTKVIKANLRFKKDEAIINLNISDHIITDNTWIAFAKPSRKINKNDIFYFDDYALIVEEKFEYGKLKIRIIRYNKDISKNEVFEFLEKYGALPLPPYIRNGVAEKGDVERYQTVYSNINGSSAAPTAGLHFTQNIINQLVQKGVILEYITLHVGSGTFLPIKTDKIENHTMHNEYYNITKQTIDRILNHKQRIIAVGTTTTRALEAAYISDCLSGSTDIFIKPGFKFNVIDGLITNFHLPKSTLMLLVSAFASRDKIMNAYNYAIENNFRFFSYGDVMLIQ